MKNIITPIALLLCTVFTARSQVVPPDHSHNSQATVVAEDPLECGFFASKKQLDKLEDNLEYQATKRKFITNYGRNALVQIDWVPIKAHIIRKTAGTDGLLVADLNDAIDNMNSYYINANMQFFLCGGINYIDDDKFFFLDLSEETALHNTHSEDNLINIYFSGVLTVGFTNFLCGFANYPGGNDLIMLSNSCAVNGSTLPHEMGHFYTLRHTHGSSNGILTTELVDGSNCDTDGDFVCDTEADPQLGSDNVNDSCIYNGTAPYTSGGGLDANGDQFVPNPNNIMSYSPLTCRDFFSVGQYARINAAHNTVRNYFSAGSVPYNEDYESFTTADNATGLMNGWTTNPENTTSAFRWNVDVDGTPSNGTGPNVDNTLGTSTGHYMHVEASDGNANDVAELVSACINLNVGAPELSFAYHMHGAAIGELHLDIYNGETWTNDIMTALVGEQTPNQIEPYSNQKVDLSAWAGQVVQLRFRAIRGNSLEGDIAIDDIDIQCVADAPVADFTVDMTTPCIGDAVMFSDSSANAFDWLWDFGVGATPATSTGVGPHSVVYSSGGNKTVTLTATGDCSADTIIKTNYLSVGSSSSSITDVSTCDNYTSPSTNYLWTSTGTYLDTIPNAVGCDSLMTINLTINKSNAGTDTQIACDSYAWPLNDTTYTSSTNSPTVTLTNAAGCDSIVTLNLTINKSNAGTDTQIACDSYTWPLNDTTYTSSTNSPTVTMTNAAGCDSIVTLNLTINNNNTGTDTQIACDSYTWPLNDTTYTNSTNSATVTLTNAAGCDSVVTLNLTINSVSDNTTSLSGSTIQANNSSASYVWLNCDDDFSIITGETNQSYTPSTNGNYAVELTENDCVDTSFCVAILTVGIIENGFGEKLLVFPNPTYGRLSIDLGDTYETVDISISDLNGKLISLEKFDKMQVINLSLKEAKGIYLLTVVAGDRMAVIRLLKN